LGSASSICRPLGVNYFLHGLITQASFFQPLNKSIRQRAKQLENSGIKPIDALHIASFEASKGDYFITCDKRLLNRCQTLNISVINPIDLIEELNHES
jgi:predicted nucleic acid-binding protein